MVAASLQHLTPERLRHLAAGLHEVTVPLRPPAPGHQRRWFQGPGYTDLILDFAEGALVRLELTFGGNWLLIEDGKVGTGRTDELVSQGERPVSKLITRDVVRNDPVVAAAHLLLTALPDTPLRPALLALFPGA